MSSVGLEMHDVEQRGQHEWLPWLDWLNLGKSCCETVLDGRLAQLAL